MEHGPNTPRKNSRHKDVIRDLASGHHGLGRESPESGSLYSDYESGQHYEQGDLPSGYNSGEQYDTLSTGYMSGEAYELPETRTEMLEPTLACIEEVSTRSNEDLFTLTMPENQLLVQAERMESSSSSSIQVSMEMTMPMEAMGGHINKKRQKKSVSYCTSVPVDKSPLGGHEARGYNELPSDTDTTSAFDSDGTYMRGEGMSSDSGAALIHHTSSRRKKRDLYSAESGIIKGTKKRLKKAKRVMRNHDEFFLIHDNRYWALARTICFWGSVVAILGSIATATVMIAFMSRTCDPSTAWWQGSVILEIKPNFTTSWEGEAGGMGGGSGKQQQQKKEEAGIDLNYWLDSVDSLAGVGIRGLKLVDMYRNMDGTDDPDADLVMNNNSPSAAADRNESSQEQLSSRHRYHYYNPADLAVIRQRVGGNEAAISALADKLHAANMTLLVEIPTYSAEASMSLDLRFNISKAIQFWAGLGVDGISLLGLEGYNTDPFILDSMHTWTSNFDQFSSRPRQYQKIFTTSYLLPEHIEAGGNGQLAATTGSEAAARFSLLNAEIRLEGDGANLTQADIGNQIGSAVKWDKVAAKPWITWNMKTERSVVTRAQLAFHMFLPGSISLSWETLPDTTSPRTLNQTILSDLLAIRQNSVPVYMNGNYKPCHGACQEEKEDNYVLHTHGPLVILERHYTRRHRYMLVANFGDDLVDLLPVSKMYSDGEVMVDTTGSLVPGTQVKFKNMSPLSANNAFVIKLPK